MMRPSHWLGSVLCVCFFSALTLLAGWYKGQTACKNSHVSLIPKGSVLKQVKEDPFHLKKRPLNRRNSVVAVIIMNILVRMHFLIGLSGHEV